MRRLGALFALALLAACGPLDDGIAAYEAGRFDAAHDAFTALLDEAGADASPELLHDAALAALAAGRAADAERAAQRLAEADDAELAGLGHFLAGNAAYERATLAAAQARAVEAEPFAFEIAIRAAGDAAQAWCRAAATRDVWPGAARNAARALRLVEALRREQRDAAANRERKTAGGGKPRIRPIPVNPDGGGTGPDGKTPDTPPSEQPADGTEPGTAGAVTEGELTPDQVTGLLERLAAREREKRQVRTERQRTAQGGVEKDW